MELREVREDHLALEKEIARLCGAFEEKYREYKLEVHDITYYNRTLLNGEKPECSITVSFESPSDE